MYLINSGQRGEKEDAGMPQDDGVPGRASVQRSRQLPQEEDEESQEARYW